MGLMKPLFFRLVLFIVFVNSSLASNDNFFVKNPSGWVEKIPCQMKSVNPKLNSEDGVVYILSDYQSNVATLEKYSRSVIKVVNEEGIKNYANIWVNYNPSYQTLNFHSINIHRGGEVYNRLDKSKFKIIQNESELEDNIFNGSFSAGYFIEDVQVGDIIEYSYTIVGENPIFKDNYFDIFYLQFGIPLQKIHCSVRYPKNYPINFKLFNTVQQPLRQEQNGLTVIKWESENVPEIITNSQQPTWYSPYPRVQLSTFSTWSDLVNWGEKLYPAQDLIGTKLEQEMNNILKGCKTEESKINALIQFVKDQIRYVGIEISEYSQKPRNPENVYLKRFGDCKEKSYMLSSMLNKIGVESYVAYVGTGLQDKIVNYLPSPTIFNHAIVALKYKGELYFIDPTVTGQKGDFTNFFNGNLKKALIINSKYSEPVAITFKGVEKVVVKETLEVIDSIQPVQYTIHSFYYGSEADKIRNQFKTSTKKEIENSYLNFYSRDYPKMRVCDSITIEEVAEGNCVKVIEKYYIDSFWNIDSTSTKRVGYIDALNLKSFLTNPEQRNRKHPFYLYYPVDVENEIIFKHAESFNNDPINGQINNSCFSFKYDISKVNDKTIVFKYSYKSLKDYVDTTEMHKYFTDYENLRNSVFYTFTWSEKSGKVGTTNWIFVVMSIFFVTILVFVAVHLYKNDIQKPFVARPLDIGGWLVLPAIGLFITPIILIVQFLKNEFFNQVSWELVSSVSSSSYDSFWALAFVYELLMNCALFVYIIFIIILFIKRRTIFPLHYIIFRSLYLAIIIGEMIIIAQIKNPNYIANNSNATDLAKAIVGAGIWIPYMLYSERVKDTFVFKHKKNVTSEANKT